MTAGRSFRGPTRFEYQGSARVMAWFDVLDDDTFLCRCGWRGTTRELAADWHGEVIDGSCRQCDTMLLVRPRGATDPEIRKAAKAGHPGAVQMLEEQVRRRPPRKGRGETSAGAAPRPSGDANRPDPPPNAYSEPFMSALVVAAALHRTQYRKGTSVPYVSHLLGTCAIALEFGADQDQAISALLHDAIEDVRPVSRARDAVAQFGPEVLRIVEACSDADTDPKPPWRVRKEAYLAKLKTEDAAVLLVSASDKLHNARAIVTDVRLHGAEVWSRFNVDSDQPWYYRSLVDAFRENPVHHAGLIAELDRTVSELELLAAQFPWSPSP